LAGGILSSRIVNDGASSVQPYAISLFELLQPIANRAFANVV
jgi:hypothetical protein